MECKPHSNHVKGVEFVTLSKDDSEEIRNVSIESHWPRDNGDYVPIYTFLREPYLRVLWRCRDSSGSTVEIIEEVFDLEHAEWYHSLLRFCHNDI